MEGIGENGGRPWIKMEGVGEKRECKGEGEGEGRARRYQEK